MLSLLIFTPVCMALLLLAIPANRTHLFRWAPIAIAGLQLFMVIIALQSFQFVHDGYQLIEQYTWLNLPLPSGGVLHVDYLVGVDGLSFPLVMLTVLIMLIASISSLSIKKDVKGFSILILILNGAILGAFCALDLLVFYLFFEFMLIPLYFLIGIWGGPRREYASIKFLIYTLIGSLLILLVIISLYISYQHLDLNWHTFDIRHLSNVTNAIPLSLLALDSTATLGWFTFREWAFLLMLTGFLIKLPAVPFHTWLPDAHVEAPTAVSVILAALLLKVGGYSLLRFVYPIFSSEAIAFTFLVAVLGMVSIIYGALNAMASTDLKRLIAYSSVSHMGFVLLGIASATVEGVAGAGYQLISHGILSAMLFLLVGVLYDRTQDREIGSYSGLSQKMKNFTAFILIAFFASMGLPGFSGFIAEIMVILGAFSAENIPGWIAVLSTGGLVLTAAYFLWTIQRMFYGPFLVNSSRPLSDLTRREYTILVPLAILTLLLGLWPQWLMDFLNPFAMNWVDMITNSSLP